MGLITQQSVTVCLWRNNEVFLLLRDSIPNIWCPNQWSMVGGQVDEGETLTEAIIREVKEETGCGISFLALRNWVNYYYEDAEITTTLFGYRVTNELDNYRVYEGQDGGWFDRDLVLSGELNGHYVADAHIELLRWVNEWIER